MEEKKEEMFGRIRRWSGYVGVSGKVEEEEEVRRKRRCLGGGGGGGASASTGVFPALPWSLPVFITARQEADWSS